MPVYGNFSCECPDTAPSPNEYLTQTAWWNIGCFIKHGSRIAGDVTVSCDVS